MLSVDIQGRKATPIRALPFVTNGYWNAGGVSALMIDPNRPSSFDAYLSPKQILLDGSLRDISEADFMPMLAAVRTAEKSGGVFACISALYPGVFIWQDVAEKLFSADAKHLADFTGTIYSSWPDEVSKQWNDAPIMSPEQRELVMEGFELFMVNSAGKTKAPARDEKGNHIKWKHQAIGVADQLISLGIKPSARAVAKELRTRNPNYSQGTITREIDRSWWL